MKKFKRTFTASKIVFHVAFVAYSLASVATPILLGNASIINTTLGIKTTEGNASTAEGNMYFNTKFKSMAEVHQASLDIIDETLKEGTVGSP